MHKRIWAWRRLRHVCTCGLPWPCLDKKLADRAQAGIRTASPGNQPAWNAPTRHYSNAPLLTRGQGMRTNTGRWR
jgi:hypothetical protein